MLVAVNLQDADTLSFLQHRKIHFHRIHIFVRAFLIQGGKAGERFMLAVETQADFLPCHFNGQRLVNGR